MNTFFADYARNISKGGTFIRTERPLEVGTEFFFELALPGQTESLTLLGEVVWVVAAEAATESGPAGMGIRFKFEDESKRAELERFVRERMVDSLGAALAERLLSRKG
jgi:type IV pilus assembly protein PilZ